MTLAPNKTHVWKHTYKTHKFLITNVKDIPLRIVTMEHSVNNFNTD